MHGASRALPPAEGPGDGTKLRDDQTALKGKRQTPVKEERLWRLPEQLGEKYS